jgi:hypothetical protein
MSFNNNNKPEVQQQQQARSSTTTTTTTNGIPCFCVSSFVCAVVALAERES